MDQIKKFLKKVNKRDYLYIATVIELLLARDYGNLKVRRLKGYENIFRVRVGNNRIIFFDDGSEVIIKAIRKRDESTYHDF